MAGIDRPVVRNSDTPQSRYDRQRRTAADERFEQKGKVDDRRAPMKALQRLGSGGSLPTIACACDTSSLCATAAAFCPAQDRGVVGR